MSLKFGAFRVQEGKFRIENTTSCLYKHFWHFVIVVAVAVVVVFHQNICVFIIFIFFNFFFDEVYNFRNRVLTNQKPELVIRNCR